MILSNIYHPEEKQQEQGTLIKLRDIQPGQSFSHIGCKSVNRLLSVDGIYKIKRADDWIVTIKLSDPALDKMVYLK